MVDWTMRPKTSQQCNHSLYFFQGLSSAFVNNRLDNAAILRTYTTVNYLLYSIYWDVTRDPSRWCLRLNVVVGVETKHESILSFSSKKHYHENTKYYLLSYAISL